MRVCLCVRVCACAHACARMCVCVWGGVKEQESEEALDESENTTIPGQPQAAYDNIYACSIMDHRLKTTFLSYSKVVEVAPFPPAPKQFDI